LFHGVAPHATGAIAPALKRSRIGATLAATVRLRWVVGAVLVALAGEPFPAAAGDQNPQTLSIGTAERLVVVAPHPDDETLGAGGLMQRVLVRGGSVTVVLVTAGDGYVEAVVHETHQPVPRPAEYVAYGRRRLAEEHGALQALADGRVRLQFLGFPDGGLEALLRTHWQRTHPERSRTTDASDPPYPDAIEPDVPYAGSDLRRELVRILRTTNPTIVALPDPLDKHPDHHAAGIFTLLALNDWAAGAPPPKANVPPLPRLLAYLVHWPDWPHTWSANTPTARRFVPALELPPTLPARGLPRMHLLLTESEIAAKRAALAHYRSQQEVMASFLAAFICRTEPYTLLSAQQLQRVGNMVERRMPPEPTPQR